MVERILLQSNLLLGEFDEAFHAGMSGSCMFIDPGGAGGHN